MAYVVPIHRASSIRHAVKLNFVQPEEDCLVAAWVFPAVLPQLTIESAMSIRADRLTERQTDSNSTASLQMAWSSQPHTPSMRA